MTAHSEAEKLARDEAFYRAEEAAKDAWFNDNQVMPTPAQVFRGGFDAGYAAALSEVAALKAKLDAATSLLEVGIKEFNVRHAACPREKEPT